MRDGGAASYDFHPMSAADLPLMRRWLEMPHVREWWGEPETELGYIRDMIEGRDTTRPFIFSVDGEPMGYIQYWFVGDHQNATWIADHPWLAELPSTRLGSTCRSAIPASSRRALAQRPCARSPSAWSGKDTGRSSSTPIPNNGRAVRAYEKAGFRAIPQLLGRTGDTLIMQYELKENDPDQ